MKRTPPRPIFAAAAIAVMAAGLHAEVTPGEILLAELNCVACHAAAPAVAGRLASREAPRLAGDGVRIKPQWLRDFLADPQKAKPGTLMPDMLHGLTEPAKSETVEALTHFLMSIQPKDTAEAPAPSAALVNAGRRLYHEVGCVQCHAPGSAPRGKETDESALAELTALQQHSVPIGDTAKKLTHSALSLFLRDPLRSRPSGRMPWLRLTNEESGAIAAYLLRTQPPTVPDDPAFAIDPAKAQLGAGYFVSLQCAECHRDAAAGIAVDAARTPARRLESLRARQPAGCISVRSRSGLPKFELTDRQRTVIVAALQNQAVLETELTPDQQIKRAMTVLNCYACHARDRRGGPEGLRRDYLVTVGDADFGDEGRIPPPLTHAGAKFQPAWLRESILHGSGVRPYMAARMPIYGEPNVRSLPGLFETADAREDAHPGPPAGAPDEALQETGRSLIGATGLNCIACHNFAGGKSPGIPGLDLAGTTRRLKWDWFRRYLLDPQSLRPGTRMPSFWSDHADGGKKAPPGDPEKQIAAIWAYLSRLDFPRLPDGIIAPKK
ncbi:MAG: c-type cytochrome [Chthoniobacteraceae bacterium]